MRAAQEFAIEWGEIESHRRARYRPAVGAVKCAPTVAPC
jgi:hypothetical protein